MIPWTLGREASLCFLFFFLPSTQTDSISCLGLLFTNALHIYHNLTVNVRSVVCVCVCVRWKAYHLDIFTALNKCPPTPTPSFHFSIGRFTSRYIPAILPRCPFIPNIRLP